MARFEFGAKKYIGNDSRLPNNFYDSPLHLLPLKIVIKYCNGYRILTATSSYTLIQNNSYVFILRNVTI